MISVIVPIYNVEKFIRKCVDSIIGQTYKNLEILLVDDGSPDKCGSICDEYARKDKRIKVIHKENGGLSSARNVALDVAIGDYVMFVDSDDWVEPDFCEEAMETIRKQGVSLVSFGYNNIHYEKKGDTYKRYKRCTDRPRLLDSSEAIRNIILQDDVIFNFAWNKIYDKRLFEQVRFPIGKTFEDQAVTYILVNKAKKIYVSDKILYNYVRRNDSISSSWYTPRYCADRFEIWYQRLENIKVMCPENEIMQMQQLAIGAVEGIVYIKKGSEYNEALDDMHKFLKENKDRILNNNPSFRLKLYYYARPLLPLIKIIRDVRDSLRKLKYSISH